MTLVQQELPTLPEHMSSPRFLEEFVLLHLQFYMSVLQIIVCFQKSSCYSIFSFICLFCRSLFIFRGVRVTQSLVLYVCYVDRCLFLEEFVLLNLQFYMYVLQIVVYLQRSSCYSIFSFICLFCRSLFVFRGVRVTPSLVLCVCFVDRCLSLEEFVLLHLQFYMYVLQIVVCLFVLFLLIIVLSVLLRYTDSDYLPLVLSNTS